MKRKPYDHEGAVKLGKYVRKHYRNQLKNGALSFYFCALPYLEQTGLGLCQPITANYQQLASAGFRSVTHMKEVLVMLQGKLCEIELGTPIKGGNKATCIRRYSLKELMTGEPSRRLIDYRPTEAKLVAETLSSRPFVYGAETICPSWNVLRTGRVQSSRPNVQGDLETVRVKKLRAGLKPGEVLMYADFKRAEPSIIQSVIGYRFESDPYQLAASLLGINREDAKRMFNKLAYMRDSPTALTFWDCPKAEDAFRPYAEKLQEYKEHLWTIGAPRGEQRRYVNTISGRKIEADRGNSPHRGRVLSWQIQGTVADILNAACVKAIDREELESWRVLFPVHDAMYIAGSPHHGDVLRQLMESEAKRLKLPLSVKVQQFSGGDAIRKCE